MKVSENQLAKLTGRSRETIARILSEVKHEAGANKARLYDSKVALQIIYCGQNGEDGQQIITEAESRRRLNLKREEEIDLDMEIKRRTRIPLEAIETNNDRVLSNVAGLIKSHAGKLLDESLIADIFTEFRGIGDALKQNG